MVTSSDGYRLLFNGPRPTMINLAQDYCDLSAPCSPTRESSWLDLSQRTSMDPDTIVDALGREYKTYSTILPGGASVQYRLVSPTGTEESAVMTNVLVVNLRSSIGFPGFQRYITAATSYTSAFGTTTYQYQGNVSGEITKTVANYSDGSTRTLNFRGNPTIATTQPKPGSSLAATSYTMDYESGCANYRRCNQPNFTIDERGNRTDFTYDPDTGLIRSQLAPPNANGTRAEIRYGYTPLQANFRQSPGAPPSPSGIPVWKLTQISTCATLPGAQCVGTADEARTDIAYDENLRPISETVRTGDGQVVAVTTKSYDAVGNLLSTDGPLPGTRDTVYHFYDAVRQRTGEIAPNPDAAGNARYLAKRFTYNGDGNVTLVEQGTVAGTSAADLAGMTATSRVETRYGIGGLKVNERVWFGGGVQSLTQYSYDSQGRLQCTAIRMNPAAYDALPADACTLGAEGGSGPDRITRTVYDAAGQVVQVRRGVGTPLEQAHATYAYSLNGQRTDVIDANGNHAQMAYDGFDRQVQWNFPDKGGAAAYAPSTPANALATAGAVSASDYEAYGYDANGNRISLRRRDGRTLTFGYDALNRMVSKIVPDGCAPVQIGSCPAADATRDVYYGYDLLGHQVYARFDGAGGEGVSDGYDALGRRTASTTALGGMSRTLGYTYDAAGNRTRTTWPDGVAIDQSYDAAGRPRLTQQPDGAVIANAGYDALGRLGTLGKVGAATSYGYDGIGRLTSQAQSLASNGVAVTLGYNPAGQIISESRDNGAYAFTGYVNVDRSYAVNGLNQYTIAGPASFQYDANGNLVADGTTAYGYDAENRLVSASNGAGTTSLSYDPLGRLWQMSGPSGATRFLYDGDQLAGEYDGGGTLLRRYVHGGGEDDPLVWYEGAGLGDRRSLMADHQGSIVAVVDGNGNPIRIDTYDEYGIPGANNLGRFQYTGQAYLRELGLYRYKARVYSPTLGRFLQTDPVGYDDQVNLYAYVQNDPVNGRDPTGTQLSRIPDDLRELWKDFKEAPVATVLDVLGGLEPNPISSIAVEASAARSVVRAEASEASATVKAEKTFQTYTKANRETEQVYTGRTSGTGTPAQNIARRDSGHHMNEQGYGPARLDKSSSNPQAIRGREQQMIERNGGAQSQGGSSGNRINGISDRNTNGPACRAAANREFGPC